MPVVPIVGEVPSRTFIVLSIDGCTYCEQAKELLEKHKLPHQIVDMNDEDIRGAFKKTTNTKTMPQVYLDGMRVGGFSALEKLVQAVIGKQTADGGRG